MDRGGVHNEPTRRTHFKNIFNIRKRTNEKRYLVIKILVHNINIYSSLQSTAQKDKIVIINTKTTVIGIWKVYSLIIQI